MDKKSKMFQYNRRTIEMNIEYLGTKYGGCSLTNEGAPGVCNIIKELIEQYGYKVYSIRCISRTDRGVHAIDQGVRVHLDPNSKFDAEKLKLRLNHDLFISSNTIIIKDIHDGYREVTVLQKEYQYLITKKFSSALINGFSWSINSKVFEKMKKYISSISRAATKFYSLENDKYKHVTSPPYITSTINVKVLTGKILNCQCIIFRVVGDRFNYRQIRNMVGEVYTSVKKAKNDTQLLEDLASKKEIEWKNKKNYRAPPIGLTLISIKKVLCNQTC